MSKITIIGLIVSLILAFFFSPFASQLPDGLEKVAKDKGFLEKAEGKNVFHAPIPDYQFPGVKNERLSTAIAGVTGTILVFAITYVACCIISKITRFQKK